MNDDHDLEQLRERLVVLALDRRVVAVRYRFHRDIFRPLCIGKIALVQSAHVGILPSPMAEMRVIPIASIATVEIMADRKKPPAAPPEPAPVTNVDVEG